MEPLNEDERASAFHAVDKATMVLLDPPVMEAVVAAVVAIENAVGLMIERDLDRAGSTGAVMGAVVQRLIAEAP